MKYDTTPLSIDTAGVDLTPPERELRFVPEEAELPKVDPDSGPISQQTVVASSRETQIGYATFIESPAEASRFESIKDSLDSPRYRAWTLTALIAILSAFAGGSAVYWVSSERSPETTVQPQSAAPAPITEIQTSTTFVAKPPADSAAEEPLVPHTPEAPAHRERPRNNVIRGGETAEALSEDPATSIAEEPPVETAERSVIEQPNSPPEPEAKVGAYVAEKSTGRKPLARCADGTYSYSASKSAACAGRGGIGEWIGEGKPAPATPTKQAAYVLGPRGGCYYLDSSNKKNYVEKKYCQQ